jgi:hypothetical protein
MPELCTKAILMCKDRLACYFAWLVEGSWHAMCHRCCRVAMCGITDNSAQAMEARQTQASRASRCAVTAATGTICRVSDRMPPRNMLSACSRHPVSSSCCVVYEQHWPFYLMNLHTIPTSMLRVASWSGSHAPSLQRRIGFSRSR